MTAADLPEALRKVRPRPQDVIRVVSEYTGITATEILGRTRTPRISRARAIAVYLCYKLTGYSFLELAKVFHRDHSTLVVARDRIEQKASHVAEFAQGLDHMRAAVVKHLATVDMSEYAPCWWEAL